MGLGLPQLGPGRSSGVDFSLVRARDRTSQPPRSGRSSSRLVRLRRTVAWLVARSDVRQDLLVSRRANGAASPASNTFHPSIRKPRQLLSVRGPIPCARWHARERIPPLLLSVLRRLSLQIFCFLVHVPKELACKCGVPIQQRLVDLGAPCFHGGGVDLRRVQLFSLTGLGVRDGAHPDPGVVRRCPFL